MGLEFIHGIIKYTLFVAVACLLAGIAFNQPAFGAGMSVGAIWGALNFFVTKHFLKNIITLGSIDYIRVYVISLIKFPLLYLVGYSLMTVKYFSLLSLIFGFSLIFVVIFLKGLGYLFTRKAESA